MSAKVAADTISMVIPVCNEEENVKAVYCQVRAVLSSLKLSYEVIFVDDGSKDRTYQNLKNIQMLDERVKIIKLFKNYGQMYAFLAGFEFVKGDIIITMDGDLQNEPQDIAQFLIKIEEGPDLVTGWRYNRKDSFIRKLISNFANWLIGMKTGVRSHDYGCTLMVIRRDLIDKLKNYGSASRFIKPLLVRLANSVYEIKVKHHFRISGASKYNLLRIIRTGVDFLLHFTIEPQGTNRMPYIIEEVIGD
ncbi:MAG: glycosyltransferase family 2 protein [Candidatus Omnitrophica bacterium]|nr:glycosyltransferase family 2 protein [Candidatus Omnitrophota bacterium]